MNGVFPGGTGLQRLQKNCKRVQFGGEKRK